MKQTYLKNKDKKSKTGRARNYWERVDYFDSLLADNATVTLSNIHESMVPNDEVGAGDVTEDSGDRAQNSEEGGRTEPLATGRGKKRKISLPSSEIIQKLEDLKAVEEQKIEQIKKLSTASENSTNKKVAALEKLK